MTSGTMAETDDGRATALRRVAFREQAGLAMQAVPAAALIGFLLVVPLVWLIGLSFIDKKGALTLGNYTQMFTDTSYANSLWLTVWLAGLVTLICAVAGYLLAYAMTVMPRWAAGLCLALVALPFWTSLLVRTYAWLVLLQNRGVVNKLLVGTGMIEEPLRMMHNLTGTMIGMTHIMLPFMVFPLYAALRRIDADYVKAAVGLGASPTYAFWRVFFPLSLPGLLAGGVLVFVLSLGFYITPALLGGGRTIVMALAIERDVNLNLNWGPASAVAVLFVAAVLGIFALVGRFMSLDRVFQR